MPRGLFGVCWEGFCELCGGVWDFEGLGQFLGHFGGVLGVGENLAEMVGCL